MGESQWWLSISAGALCLGLQLALPAFLLGTAGGLVASFLQTLVGYGDSAIGFALRAVGVVAGLVIFGGWLASALGEYWHAVGRQLTQLLGSGL